MPTTTTNPHPLFDVYSADETAECMSVPEALYAKLWNEIVPEYAGQPRSECGDDAAGRGLSRYWGRFTADEQAALNAAAVKYAGESVPTTTEQTPQTFVERFDGSILTIPAAYQVPTTEARTMLTHADRDRLEVAHSNEPAIVGVFIGLGTSRMEPHGIHGDEATAFLAAAWDLWSRHGQLTLREARRAVAAYAFL